MGEITDFGDAAEFKQSHFRSARIAATLDNTDAINATTLALADNETEGWAFTTYTESWDEFRIALSADEWEGSTSGRRGEIIIYGQA